MRLPVFLLLLISMSLGGPNSSLNAQTLPNLADVDNPEVVIRLLVEANAKKDLATMKRFMGGDPHALGYTIGGRKFIGWEEFAKVMETEFRDTVEIKIPITHLQVTQRGDIAWFALELDYTRVTRTQDGLATKVIPLRETGVLERQQGTWQLVNWHESMQKPLQTTSPIPANLPATPKSQEPPKPLTLAGIWEIQEEDKTYQATLDEQGNGPYTHEQGTFTTTELDGRLWSGTWAQKGNDREGEFEVLLSEDFMTAEGVWWYTRVEEHKNIPPRMHGGSYLFTRIGPTVGHAPQSEPLSTPTHDQHQNQ
ncbi:nuclear transport factor 2 family protein [Candidatus Nitronereus thalassa]|uniref:Nuclear transport factor 2 family protein n=1 Tax=Candidatus Nitronereus thalassa TaxID=3020898 RepID=A0ABU3K4W1_9BACT|nr:nuclear transport factor 2 family protein [Candidatus Nitronereus thalassa]MDT7041440.1 nuclear transport factor 2 family protein [Candidatus Nitronereus thalassa]